MPPTPPPTPLFGGALTASLPPTYTDVSTLRPVPDHQEVFLDPHGFTSVVVEVLERVEGVTDEEALRVHLRELVREEDEEEEEGEGDGGVRIWESERRERVGGLPPTTPVYTLLATTPPGAKQRGANAPVFVGVLLTLIRLREQQTDLIVAVNVPHVRGSYDAAGVEVEKGRYGPLMEEAVRVRERVLETLEVRDWGLFGGEGAENGAKGGG